RQSKNIAQVERQFNDLTRSYIGRDIGIVDVEQRGLSGNGDLLRHCPRGKRNRLPSALTGRQNNSILAIGLKTIYLDLQSVRARRKQGKDILSRTISCEDAREAPFWRRQCNFCARDNGTRAVGY